MALTREQVEKRYSRRISEDEMREVADRYIDPNPGGFGVSRARLKESGTTVATIVADIEAESGNLGKVAQDFQVSIEAVLGALYFYWQHRDVIDAEIAVRRSGFVD